nr:G protein-coupled receptor [Proales similis]
MLFHASSVVFILTCFASPKASANNSETRASVCAIQLWTRGDPREIDPQLRLLNRTIQKCHSKTIRALYTLLSQNEPSGERLSEFNQYFLPLLVPVSGLKALHLIVEGGNGLSVDFKIPDFLSRPSIFLNLIFFNFRLLFNDGAQANEFCSGSLDTGPFSYQSPINLLVKTMNRYHLNTCPLLFSRAFIFILSIHELIDSAVKFNMLTFEQTNRTLDSRVSWVRFYGYGLRFDSKLFALDVFGKTQNVVFGGMMNSFEAGALKQSMVTSIMLAISRLRKFLHNNPHWLNEVNQRKTEKILLIEFQKYNQETSTSGSDISYIGWIESNRTDSFEDSSFCIFYQIEQHSLNVLFFGRLIETRANEGCSCLLLWIVTDYQADNISCSNQAQLREECKFDNMAQRCSIETVEPLHYRTIYETILDLEFFTYLTDVWLTPVSSVLGILANFLVISTFSKINKSPEYRRKKLTDKGRFMWVYTYYNSWFVLFHAITFTCTPLVTCIELYGIYCSPLVTKIFYRYFYLLVEKFLGNTFRLAANMSSTLFVLYRFGLNTDKLVRFRKLKPSKSVACIFVLSVSISVITLFVNEKFTVNSLSTLDIAFYITLNLDILKLGILLKTAYILNTFLVTTVFTLLNMGIDLRLLSLMRSHNTERRKEEAEKRITKMVILNGLFSFLFRLPEMISATSLLVYAIFPKSFPVCFLSDAHFHSVCPMLFSISHFLLTISYLENLVLLYYFNDSFRKYFEWPLRTACTRQQTGG